ncbi:NAD(P)/FAD-dependent oxidoreductase [Pseudonocardia sp. KRD-184]|uniref:NAD(P)/FAD-dependent oxidoreductase n=1 Tax=Pseudonocardia oceani TaxID=2792013 RepID=A0ABS6U407_9PSEU|nr:NAD(P)/FAD-dependent oxidoreductase [Pseudonocardia oceani]MBW0096056.1 NAD(P)/FAD-dependent oxidoreductase [Pseudonocardia oceani]MBW0121062.1 NAD(P)/FAD-dependent oxidoreductase [Pseudonocardia oceani]MBW0126967.1 NAD(P)/FAD-dependent oxidoreductase [Pseudonocardia oceani]
MVVVQGQVAVGAGGHTGTVTDDQSSSAVTPPEHVDVLVVGAGLSGIGAAWRLQQERPGTTYAIIEARDAIGGTWDLFRYPGVRSDSDMFTLSYPFRPWTDAKSMADGESIRRYITDTAAEGGIDRHIRFGTRVVSASWSSADARWTVRTLSDAGEQELTCGFLYVCTGYYDYAHGHQPVFAGLDDFTGEFVHPQSWPADLDHTGKRVAVIGSGATAVTLVPAMAGTAAHVTMVQRSPSYLTALPGTDALADTLRRVLPAGLAHTLVRAKNVAMTQAFYQLSRRRPERVKAILRSIALRFLQDPAYVDEHFTPTYQPWDQRLCVVPDGDFFRAVRRGDASVVTGHIDRFVPSGIRMTTGEVVEADVVVSATGLSLLAFGGIELSVDGTPVDVGEEVTYRGVMLSGVPNLAYCIGYTNASWTLRADLSSRYVTRLLGYMQRRGYASATPSREAAGEGRRPLLDLSSGYVQRAIDRFPRQGARNPWTTRQNYVLDALTTPWADLRRDMAFAPAPAARPVVQDSALQESTR